MKLESSFKTAIDGLRTNKIRSILTMLGMVIGIASIILVMALGKGAQELILDEVRSLGSTTIAIEPGREPKGPRDHFELHNDSLTQKDLDALKKKSNVPGLKDISPTLGLVATVAYKNETIRTNIGGGSEINLRILDLYPEVGRMFTDEEVARMAKVAVISSNVKDELFGLSDAIGKKIKIKNHAFKVVGVLPRVGKISHIDADDVVVIPYTTMQKYLLGIKFFHSIIAQAETEGMVPQVVRDIKATLRETHSITDPKRDDFHVYTPESAMERVLSISSILTTLFFAIATISLAVGGIGIMNIMLVSVTERTREIGLRKAVGATENDILAQFLLESITLTLVGGGIGIIAGAGLTFMSVIILIKFANLPWVFSFPIPAALLGLGVAAVIGLVFGLFPAYKASQKSPIESLRYE